MGDLALELLIAVVFLAVMFGYGWGRRHGRRDGFIEGLRLAPLEMRRSSLEKGGCVICGTTASTNPVPGSAAHPDA